MPMSRAELINLIGTVIFNINSKLTELDQGQPAWNAFDDLSDNLIHFQKKLIKVGFDTNTSDIIKQTTLLKKTNEQINTTIKETSKTAETINNIAKFVGVVEEIVKLIGVFALLNQKFIQQKLNTK